MTTSKTKIMLQLFAEVGLSKVDMLSVAHTDTASDLARAERFCQRGNITHSYGMRECCKGDDASQWENGKFDPLPRPNPLTDRHKKLHT